MDRASMRVRPETPIEPLDRRPTSSACSKIEPPTGSSMRRSFAVGSSTRRTPVTPARGARLSCRAISQSSVADFSAAVTPYCPFCTPRTPHELSRTRSRRTRPGAITSLTIGRTPRGVPHRVRRPARHVRTEPHPRLARTLFRRKGDRRYANEPDGDVRRTLRARRRLETRLSDLRSGTATGRRDVANGRITPRDGRGIEWAGD